MSCNEAHRHLTAARSQGDAGRRRVADDGGYTPSADSISSRAWGWRTANAWTKPLIIMSPWVVAK
jgi:hypothetical protein